MLKMPEWSYSISKKYGNRVTLTVRFWVWGSLLMIESWSLDVQQAIGMTRMLWIGLKRGNQFATFLEFFETCFLFYTPPISFFLICKCSLCTLEWIRVANLFQIFSIYDHLFMIWSFVQIFPNQAKWNLLYPYVPCTIWSHFQLCNKPKHAQNLKIWLVFDIFIILFWFNLI